MLRRRLHHRQVILVACAAWAGSTAVATFGSGMAALVGSWLLFSLMIPVYFSTMYARRVSLVPDGLLGRVNSIYRLLSQASPPVGVAVGGMFIGLFGARPVAASLAFAFAVTAVAAWKLTAPRAVAA